VGDATADGLTGSAGGDTVTYGDLVAATNNDCPAPSPPSGVVSVTVFGRQQSPAGNAVISLCLPRPDLLGDGTQVALAEAHQPALDSDRAQLVDVEGAPDADCRWSLAGPPDGTARFDGFCDDGADPAGFALTLDATVPVTKVCAGVPDETIELTLAGTVAVVPD
jgi:hypothetical protein